jgi:hypothetical protein
MGRPLRHRLRHLAQASEAKPVIEAAPSRPGGQKRAEPDDARA